MKIYAVVSQKELEQTITSCVSLKEESQPAIEAVSLDFNEVNNKDVVKCYDLNSALVKEVAIDSLYPVIADVWFGNKSIADAVSIEAHQPTADGYAFELVVS